MRHPDIKKSTAITRASTQEAIAPKNKTGVSTNYAPTATATASPGEKSDQPKAGWYVLRTTYGREQKACNYMTEKGCTVFLPTIKTVKKTSGHISTITESRFPNIFFAWGEKEYIETFVYDNVHLPYLRFYYRYYNKNHTRYKEPIVVPRKQMDTLRIICQAEEDDILLQHENVEKFTQGEKVCIVDGPFKGAEGFVARYKGQQRVGIVIAGVLTAATTYIPSAFLKKISDNPRNSTPFHS